MGRKHDYVRWPRIRMLDGEVLRLDEFFDLPPIVSKTVRTGNGFHLWPELPGDAEHFTLLGRDPPHSMRTPQTRVQGGDAPLFGCRSGRN